MRILADVLRTRVAASTAIVLLVSCAPGQPPNSAMPSAQGQAVQSFAAARNVAHLYVTNNSSHTILRYPLTNGIPAQTPDAVIAGGDPRGIAIGPDGRVYVVDGTAQELLIYAPAPNSNAKPVRTVDIGRKKGLSAVTVDPLGNVYVTWAADCTDGFTCSTVYVYSPYADGTKKIVSFSLGGGNGGSRVRSMDVSADQTFVAQLGFQSPTAWTNAPQMQNVYPIFCGARDDYGNVWITNQELVETDIGGGRPPTPAQIVVIPNYRSGGNCPQFYSITSSTVPLKTPMYVAAAGNTIYVTDVYNNSVGSALVFVFDASKPGAQKPMAILGGPKSQLLQPGGIAVGP